MTDNVESSERTGLYIHIPLCHSKCRYCDFYSTPLRPKTALAQQETVTDSLIREYQLRSADFEPVTYWRTIYLGGGTPSALQPRLLEKLLSAIPGKERSLEITVEANPDDVTPQWLELVKRCGVTRVSMGIQSFHDNELKTIGRRHNSATAQHAAGLLAASGLDFSLDLIYGLPEQSLSSWTQNLSRLFSYNPPHFSAYLLSYEEGTMLTRMKEGGKVTEAPDSLVESMYATLCAESLKHGYNHYEISNFALPHKQAVHNSSYWYGWQYLGLGPSAHSFIHGKRFYNPPHTETYIKSLETGHVPAIEDKENEIEAFNSHIITALRTSNGLSQQIFNTIDAMHKPLFIKALQEQIKAGNIIETKAGNFRIPEEKLLISDSILGSLILI